MKTRTFDEIWRDLEKLKGKTVFTLVYRVRSDIIEVNSSGMLRRSERWKQVRHVDRSAFQRTWKNFQ